MATSQLPITLEIALRWAYSGHESDKVYRFLFLHPDDFFTIPKQRSWPIAHQVVFNGDVFLLRRILALFYDDQINIRTLSADKKTLLDVAQDRRKYHEEMYNYVEQLFLRDDLIQAAKKNHWNLVNEILEQNPKLVNEKPPYSPFFLLHYIVQSGDEKIFKDLFHRFKFDTDVFSTDLETPLDLARRLKQNDICSILEQTTKEQSKSEPIKCKPSISINAVESSSSKLPYPIIDPFPLIDFHNNSILITQTGEYQLEKKSFFSVTHIELPISDKQLYPTTENVNQIGNIDNQFLSPNSELIPMPMTPVTPSTNSQLIRNLTCPLTQQIFIDPVIASDGQTYERAAIIEWITRYQCSPMTGAKIDTIFKDNIEVKQIIQSMRK